MALSDWWQPWAYGGYSVEEPILNFLEILNSYLPYMNPYEQSQAAQYLYGIGGQGNVLPVSAQAYNIPVGPASSTSEWLQRLAGGGPSLSSYFADTPEGNWLQGLQSQAAQLLKPGMTREEQRRWNLTLTEQLARAPSEEFQQLGTSLYSPTLASPMYGQSAPLGRYVMPYRTKGGLVANPWFV